MVIRRRVGKVLVYLILIIALVLILLPVMETITTSFKTETEIDTTADLFTVKPVISNFTYAMAHGHFGREILNSFFYSAVVTALCMVFSCMAGYVFARFESIEFTIISFILLIIFMFPMILIAMPIYMTLVSLKLLNTVLGIVLVYLSFQLIFSVWMMRSFFKTIPKDMEEAAEIDGCSRLRTLFSILVPISLPGLATVGVFSFIRCWNEYMLASLIVSKQELATVSIGLRAFVSQDVVMWGPLCAASVISMIPSFLILIFAQKYLVQGLASGGVKG
jgi:ABC-type glycerol-3-phosphate transport system permease component